MAYDYLKANAKKIGIDRDASAYDLNIQVMSLMQGKDANDLGVAFFIALISAVLSRPIAGGLVVLGQMSLHGVLEPGRGAGRQAAGRDGCRCAASDVPDRESPRLRRASAGGDRQVADRAFQ